eukprot:TRINITY_DN57278_c0_g1_i1.p1 TRINITY_DN57278_c0_g1~~TRINITY_DN57278_c0_g1_i1.p1  ORF type:complete len:290 (-),score=36.49 TRINITY_DN57278_c0_g1_i1:369-1238(-)
MMTENQPTLDNKGRNELTRLIFAVGKIDIIDEEISMVEYMKRRDAGKLPYGQVPTLQLSNGLVLGQSCAIARYAARLASLYPETPTAAAKADAVVESWRDQLDLFYDVVFERTVIGGKLQMFPRPQYQRAQLMELYLRVSFQPWLAQIDAQLASGFVCSQHLCFADLAIFDLVRTIESISNPATFEPLLEAHGRVHELTKYVGNLPEVTEYLTRHPYKDIRHFVAHPTVLQRFLEACVLPSLKMLLGAWVKARGCFDGVFKPRTETSVHAAPMPSLLQSPCTSKQLHDN